MMNENILLSRRQKMNNEFKINVFFQQDGEEIESILANYLITVLNNKGEKSKYCM